MYNIGLPEWTSSFGQELFVEAKGTDDALALAYWDVNNRCKYIYAN